MNDRRGFLKQMLMAGAAFTILPPAETYGRVWRAARPEKQMAGLFGRYYILTDSDTRDKLDMLYARWAIRYNPNSWSDYAIP